MKIFGLDIGLTNSSGILQAYWFVGDFDFGECGEIEHSSRSGRDCGGGRLLSGTAVSRSRVQSGLI